MFPSSVAKAKKGGSLTGRASFAAQGLCAGLALLLAACSGGGGGSSTPDLSTVSGLTVNPASLSFAAVHNGAIPPTQNIQITISRQDAAFLGLAVPAGNPPTWLDYQNQGRLNGSGSNWTFTAAILSTSLAPGTYTTTLSIGIADANQNILASRDVQVSYTVTSAPATASPNALNFSSVVGGPAPAAQSVTLMGDVGAWTASPNQTWIGVAPSSGSGAGNASVSVNTAGLGPNTYNGSVTFNTAGGPASVNVTLVVAAPAIQPSSDSLTFSGVNGATLASQALNITMNNGAALSWTANPADAWLVLDRTSGTASDPLIVSVNPANGALAFGNYNSSISLQASSGGSTFNKTVNVTMLLTRARLTANPASVTLGGSNGRDLSGVPVQLGLNTGVNSFPWNSTASSFVQRSPSSGSVSATPLSVTLTPNATGLSAGTHIGSVAFSAQVNGDVVSTNVSVTFNQESHKLLVDGNGVAFAKTPALAKLTRTLRVRDNLGLATAWTATKDQSWLTVTASGTAGDDLVLTADPTGLTPDTLSLATVTITSPDTTVENTETIRVGLWVGSTDPDPTTTITGLPYAQIAADPIRPYAYVGVGKDIHIINVYNGSPLTPLLNVVPARIGAMTTSHDGSALYVVDEVLDSIVPVNLDTYRVGTQFSTNSLSTPQNLEYTRANGMPLILTGAGLFFNAATGAQFHGVTFPPFGAVGASRNGSRFCFLDIGNSSYNLSCWTLDFTSLNGGQLLVGNSPSVMGVGVNAADIAVSPDGNFAYVASGAGALPPELSLYSAQNLTHLGGFSIQGRGNNVEVAADSRIFAGSTNVSIGQTADVRVLDAGGNLLTTRLIAPVGPAVILDRQMKVSGDGLRLITLTGDPPAVSPSLIFTTVAP